MAAERARLTSAQIDVLTCLAIGPRTGITDERVVRALERKGLAERIESSSKLAIGSTWRITKAGLERVARPARGGTDGR